MTDLYELEIYDTITQTIKTILVSEKIYNEYRRGEWRIEKNNKKHKYNNVLFSDLKGGTESALENFHEFVSMDLNPEEIELISIRNQKLHEAIENLCMKERIIIKSFYFYGLSEQEIADMFAVKQQTIHKRKAKILKKIKIFLKNGC